MRAPFAVPTLLAAVAGLASPALAQDRHVVFVFDQSADHLIRLDDKNGDGDAHDEGEATVFYDDTPAPALNLSNTLGLVAIDPWTVLATDNFEPQNVLLLRDLNRDGDAFDEGEASEWWDGITPSGLRITLPMELRPEPDGSYLLLDNNTLDTTRPEAVYRLEDVNGDGDVNDDGEVSTLVELSPIGESSAATFDVVRDNAGTLYTMDIHDPNGQNIEHVDKINPDTGERTVWFTSTDLYLGLELLLTLMNELEHIPETDEIVMGVTDLPGTTWIIGVRDEGSRILVRRLWHESDSPLTSRSGHAKDFARTDDGSLYFPDAFADRVVRLTDLDDDHAYRRADETSVLYDDATAESLGQPRMTLPLSIAAVPADESACAADRDGDGDADVQDLLAYLSDFRAGDADFDDDQDTDVQDLLGFLSAFRAGC